MEYDNKIKNIGDKNIAPQSLITWGDFGYEKVDDVNRGQQMAKIKKDDHIFLCKLKEGISNENKFNEEKLINNILIEESQNNKIENDNIVIPKAIELIQSRGFEGIIYEYFNDSTEKYDCPDEEKISILLRVDKFIKSIPFSERLKLFLQKRTVREYHDDIDKCITAENNKIKSMAIELRGLLRVDDFELFDEVLNHGDLDMSNIGYNPKTQKIAIFDLEALCIGNSINALAHCSYQSVLYKIYNSLSDKDKQQMKRWDIIAGADFYKIIESKITEAKSLKQFYGVNMFYALSECYDGLSIKNNDKVLEIELERNADFFYENLKKLNKIAQ
ncbi:MAG: hypothetical protein WCT37_00245 [Patescibacteria group bacterium]